MSLALYEIADDYRKALAFDLDTEDDATALVALLDEITDRFENKAANVCAYIKNVNAEADAFQKESDKLALKAKALRRRAENLTYYLEVQMRRSNIDECKAGLSSLKFVKNPWKVEIEPGAEIPQEYMTVPEVPKSVPDKKELAKALKAGVKIEGVRLVQDERLRIA